MKKYKILTLVFMFILTFGIGIVISSQFSVSAREELNDNYTDLQHIESDEYTDSEEFLNGLYSIMPTY